MPRDGNKDALRVKPDGRVFDGNTRLKVLEERGIDANGLPRKLYDDLNQGIGGGGGPWRRDLLLPEE